MTTTLSNNNRSDDNRADEDQQLINRRSKNQFFRVNTKHLGFNGRRGKDANGGSHVNKYVDWYSPNIFVVSIFIMVLSCFDAIMTLTLLDRGAYEANWFMATLIETSVTKFVIFKVALTALCIIFLVVHKNFIVFKSFRAEYALYGMLFAYGALLIWEVHLMLVIGWTRWILGNDLDFAANLNLIKKRNHVFVIHANAAVGSGPIHGLAIGSTVDINVTAHGIHLT